MRLYQSSCAFFCDFLATSSPHLQVSGVDRPRRHRLCRVEVTVPNPLPVPLTGCRLTLECAGVVRRTSERIADVQPGTDVVERVRRRRGESNHVVY